MAGDFDRQVAELHFRIANLNGYTVLGILVTETLGQFRPGKGAIWPSAELCYRVEPRRQCTAGNLAEARGFHGRLPR